MKSLGPLCMARDFLRDRAIVIVCLLPCEASADFVDGNKLLSFCSPDNSVAAGYVAGIVDAANWDVEVKVVEDVPKFCLRSNVTIGQLTEIVCRKLKDRSDVRDMPAAIFVRLVLRDVFPCKQ